MTMTGAEATDVLTGLLHDWQHAFNAHQPSQMVALFSRDAHFQGISPRLRRGPRDIHEYYARVTRGTTAQAEVLSAAQPSRTIVHGLAEVTFTAPTGDVHLVRLSIVAAQAEGRWLIHQYHAATRQPRSS
ncbi:SgcJ/EcaC family oxidoreductase [Nonomuraea sp. B12E4]|uniref:YybH family protein n=1 Tax=Nonomuraea sp. B12E4 TaxID=3153564 RepID=UPI00325EB04E